MLRIVFISWQTVVCLLNSTALPFVQGTWMELAPEFCGVSRIMSECRIVLNTIHSYSSKETGPCIDIN